MIARHPGPIASIILAATLHLLLWLPLPLLVQTVAALFLIGFLPGALLVELIVGRSAAPPDHWERVLYTIAAGYGVMTLVMLGVSYLPGGMTGWQVYATIDLLLAILLALLYVAPSGTRSVLTVFPRAQRAPDVGTSKEIVGLLILFLVAGFLRFTNLGYAEFQGDEGRVVLCAAAVMQGYEDALFTPQGTGRDFVVNARLCRDRSFD
jgi:hypothetical protein